MSRHALASLLATVALASCAKQGALQAAPAPAEEQTPRVIEKTLPDGLVLESVDINRDGRSDIFNYWRERSKGQRALVRKEVDINLDGKVDNIAYYNDEGIVERQEMDRNFDGQFDWIDHYQAGKRMMAEIDSDGDGKMDVFDYYDEQPPPLHIDRKERDTNADGKVDYWERYDVAGAVVRTGQDIDGDGKMDIRDE